MATFSDLPFGSLFYLPKSRYTSGVFVIHKLAMITKASVSAFKSFESLDIELGQLNVFVGANGSGKSNLLEALGVLSAAADGKVTDQTLMQRGVRPGVPKLYKSAFPSSGSRQLSHIYFSASSVERSLRRFVEQPDERSKPAWRFKTELFERGNVKLVSRGPAMRDNPNTENGLAALRAVELKEDDPALAFLRRLKGTSSIRPPRRCCAVSRPKLSRDNRWASQEAVYQMRCMNCSCWVVARMDRRRKSREDALELIGWAKSYGSASSTDLPCRKRPVPRPR